VSSVDCTPAIVSFRRTLDRITYFDSILSSSGDNLPGVKLQSGDCVLKVDSLKDSTHPQVPNLENENE